MDDRTLVAAIIKAGLIAGGGSDELNGVAVAHADGLLKYMDKLKEVEAHADA